ncbi:hypothetical protein B2J89_04255 [Acidovorax sp. SRB_24]|nr:hypothetical protein [Acidovorax sp. SRB_24]
MACSGVADIAWRAPWLEPWRTPGQAAARRVQEGLAVHRALQMAPAAPVRLVPQSALPVGMAYEQFIFDTGAVPTRDNLHDFFNGLVWLQFPQAKRRLNQLQAQAIAAHGVGPVRGPLRDALTLFDENGALLDAPAPLWQALVARDWQRLFIGLRPLWRQARLVLFGHALLEKLVFARKSVTAHVYCAPIAMKSEANLDAWLARALQPAHLSRKPFAPLPVLGVPGWWPENERVCFYDDPLVFRGPRALL